MILDPLTWREKTRGELAPMAQALADRGNQDQVVIAQDVTTEAHKRYAAIVLDDLMVLLTARANAYLYEVFTDGVGVRLYLDIEHSAGDHSSTDMLNDVAAAIAAGAAACGYVASGVWFTTASGPSSDRLCGKASFHGVAKIVNADCDEVFFPSTAAVKAFVMRFIVPLLLEYRGRKYDCAGIVPVELPHQSGDTGGAVDLMPYGHNQCFRLTFHGKLGSSRILKPYEGRLTLPRGMERREEATLVGYYGPPLPPSRLFPEADARAAAAGAKRAASAPATQRHEKKPRSAASSLFFDGWEDVDEIAAAPTLLWEDACRPRVPEDVVGQQAAQAGVRDWLASRKTAACLLMGPTGCGKTSLARREVHTYLAE
jgi:hypothetical protein